MIYQQDAVYKSIEPRPNRTSTKIATRSRRCRSIAITAKADARILLRLAGINIYLIYFDEVKDDPDTQKYFWVGSISIDAAEIKRIEKNVSDNSEEYFGTPCLGVNTEFRAADIYHRKKIYKGWSDPTKRISLIGKRYLQWPIFDLRLVS